MRRIRITSTLLFAMILLASLSVTVAGERMPIRYDFTMIEHQDHLTKAEVMDWLSNSLSVSDELIKGFANKEYQLFGQIGDSLTAWNVSKQIATEDYRGAFKTVGKWALLKLLAKYGGKSGAKANPLMVAVDAYIVSLKVIHKYVWIPKLTDKMYRLYKEQREVESAERALELVDMSGGFNYVQPVIADAKARLLEEKYGGLRDRDLTDRQRRGIRDEAYTLVKATFESRYFDEVLWPRLQVAGKRAEETAKQQLLQAAMRLDMPTRGKVVDAETSKPLSRARIRVEERRHGTYTSKDGTFYLPVPYPLVEGGDFHLFAEKEGYEKRVSRAIFWEGERKTPRILFKLKPKKKRGNCFTDCCGEHKGWWYPKTHTQKDHKNYAKCRSESGRQPASGMALGYCCAGDQTKPFFACVRKCQREWAQQHLEEEASGRAGSGK
ncbi:MAG: hypothetical protein ABW148_14380 [Sedimenticola sp.]